jgi:hypothetical protein
MRFDSMFPYTGGMYVHLYNVEPIYELLTLN